MHRPDCCPSPQSCSRTTTPARTCARAGGSVRKASERARRGGVKPARDPKLRRQFEAAIAALDEGTAALASGRKKPRRTGRKVTLALLGVAGGGAAAGVAINEDLRNSVIGSAKALGEEIAPGSDDAPSDGSQA